MSAPTLTGGAESATLTLATPAPDDGGSTITFYNWEVAAASGDFSSPVLTGSQSPGNLGNSITLSPLTAGDYKARSWAVNAEGAGTPSAASAETTVTSGAQPLTLTLSGDTLTATGGGLVLVGDDLVVDESDRVIEAIDSGGSVVATFTETNPSVFSWDIPTIFPTLAPGDYTFALLTAETAVYTVAGDGFNLSSIFQPADTGYLYQFHDRATLAQNADGTGAVSVGDPVGYVEDWSGNGAHLTQADAGRRFVAQDGFALSDGSSQFMSNAYVHEDTSTLILGVRVISTTNQFGSISATGADNQRGYQMAAGVSGQFRFALQGGDFDTATATTSADLLGQDVVFRLELDVAAGTATGYVDGVQVYQDTSYTGIASNSDVTRFGVNRGGTTGVDFQYASARFHTALEINRILSASEVSSAETEIAQQMGIITTPPPATAPAIAASDSLSGRTLTIAVDTLTGDPAPSVALSALTLDGVSVLGDHTGSGPWSYVVPDSADSQTVAWTLTATNSEGTDTASGMTVVADTAPSSPPFLDDFPGAARAHALRLLSSTYTGPVVQVRRSDDLTTNEFTADEVTDGTMLAWVTANDATADGTVPLLYDQSGNGVDYAIPDQASEPLIVEAGVQVVAGDGTPAINTFIAARTLRMPTLNQTGWTFKNSCQISVAEKKAGSTGRGWIASLVADWQIDQEVAFSYELGFVFGAQPADKFGITADRGVYIINSDLGNYECFQNGASVSGPQTTSRDSANNTITGGIGSYRGEVGGSETGALWQETIVYFTPQTANLAAMNANIANHYPSITIV